jgi:hypothetical protein
MRATSAALTRAVKIELSALALIGLVICLACGRVPSVGEVPAGATASASRTVSPLATATSSAPALPDPKLLTARGCSGQAFDTTPRAVGYPHYKIRLASGWTEHAVTGPTESLLLQLTAPASYGHAPTRIEFHVFPGGVHDIYGPNATAHTIAAERATIHYGSSRQAVSTSVADCSIASESAAVYGYTDGSEVGYRLSFIHRESLFEVWLAGVAGLDTQAVEDSLRMIGSIVWVW